MIDAIEFNVLWQKEEFRRNLSEDFERVRTRLELEFPEKDRIKIAEYEKAGFQTRKDLSKSAIKGKSSVSNATFDRFMKGSPSLTYESFCKIVKVFEPIFTAEALVAPSRRLALINFNEDVERDLNDVVTLEFLRDEHDLDYEPYGPAIEIRRLGALVSDDQSPRSIGVDPGEINFRFSGAKFEEFDQKIMDNNIIKDIRERKIHNEEKLSLVGLYPHHDMIDACRKVDLYFRKTDYETIVGSLSHIADIEDLNGNTIESRNQVRRLHGNLDPARNRVPNSFCLHYIVRFSDFRYLAIHRHNGVAYDRLKLSVSGEEQIKPSDLSSKLPYPPGQTWAMRAIMEEVFPRRDYAVDSREGKEIAKLIASIRFLTLLYEERYCNYAITAFIQMNISVEEYIKIYRQGIISSGKADFEGNRYHFSEVQIEKYFSDGYMILKPFKRDKPELKVVTKSSNLIGQSHVAHLHSTSLYRLWLAGVASGNLFP
ncbi:hypothetical protein [Jiella pelagia]|uniref:Uncharacterized protein n=1 Tax=Jiella pelagia TaxID=2986949 RepID=A0ABY7C618_9HYPH|nr:hypothetical protein [Jiella pelagia]WAP69290.1 hypothetical protein OH818_03040 [Jiella pelagia]